MKSITLKPASVRDYRSAQAAREAWRKGNHFLDKKGVLINCHQVALLQKQEPDLVVILTFNKERSHCRIY